MAEQNQPTDAQQSPQAVEIPLAASPNAKEGDTITLTVVSVDAQNGVIMAAPASMPEESEKESTAGTDEMAEEMAAPPTQ